ncbi:hypothetical protein T11_7104 [Trichinella zimbabwensis]|uniref:Uncharacterized protein n=1 Tax=Trichinella zimbabwensis TaxID=268475 RepID=A0A0V1HL10_9BILA|nr:hypothetical protein T11_7104 [Trichinella zimbabwensis]
MSLERSIETPPCSVYVAIVLILKFIHKVNSSLTDCNILPRQWRHFVLQSVTLSVDITNMQIKF